jgi:anti-sigma factor RsiW
MAPPPPSPPIGEDDLHAWVDGRLSPARAAEVAAFLATRPALAARLQADAAQRARLRAALIPVAAEPIPARLRLAQLRAQRRQRWRGQGRVAAAAVLLLGLGTSLGWTLRGQVEPGFAATPLAEAPLTLTTLPSAPLVAFGRESALGPWLADHLGEEMPLPDLAGFGFQPDAAWVWPDRGAPAALLRYVDPDGIALSLWREVDARALVQPLRCDDGAGGLVTYAWSDGRHRYALSALLPRERLRPIAVAVERFMREAPRQPLLAALPRRPCLTGTG